ncbi:hypothetical protein QUF76_02715 [Desulfobacterales bacterium HSG16]|nr:hypothetical protein [Desulfobacterales bacterium HSG16]
MTLNSSHKDKTHKDKNSLKTRLSREIQTGIDSAKDSENADLPDLAIRTTTMYSKWYTRHCPTCKLKFREQDQVRLCPQCSQAYHDDDQYNLRCWERHFANERNCKNDSHDPINEVDRKGCYYKWNGKFPDDDDSRRQPLSDFSRVEEIGPQFLSGLENIRKPFGEEKIEIVKEYDEKVGLKCPWCRFLIRPGDHVVACPCGKCNTWFHMDIYRHLTCWNEWNGFRGNNFCPETSAKIEKAPEK